MHPRDVTPVRVVRREAPQEVTLGIRTHAMPEDGVRVVRGPCALLDGSRTVAVVTRYPGGTKVLAEAVERVTCPRTVRSDALIVSTRVWGRFAVPKGSRACVIERDCPEVSPVLRAYAATLGALYREVAPAMWRDQSVRVRRHRLADEAPWTTGSINRATATAYHRDTRNVARTWSGMLVLRGEGVTGGELVLPEYGVTLDLHDGDVLFFAGAEAWHGNLPLHVPEGSWRYSLPCYAMEM